MKEFGIIASIALSLVTFFVAVSGKKELWKKKKGKERC
jgi:hypothetical protein